MFRAVGSGLRINLEYIARPKPHFSLILSTGADSGIHLGRGDDDFSVTTPELLTPGESMVATLKILNFLHMYHV